MYVCIFVCVYIYTHLHRQMHRHMHTYSHMNTYRQNEASLPANPKHEGFRPYWKLRHQCKCELGCCNSYWRCFLAAACDPKFWERRQSLNQF